MSASGTPSQTGFHVDIEDEGGEGVTLDGAPANRDGISSKARGALKNDAGRGIRVDTLNDID